MLHDESVYPEPFEFKPDRFMKDGQLNLAVRDPAHAAFGFGRRYSRHYCNLKPSKLSPAPFSVCPGRYMAFSAVWIAIASLIAAFDIEKAVDENGEVIEPSQEYSSALVV